MMMNLTHRPGLQNGTGAAAHMRWQPCTGLLVVRLSAHLSPLSPDTFGGNQIGQAESIKGSAIKDRRYLNS